MTIKCTLDTYSLRRDFEKIAPYPSCNRDYFLAKVPGHVNGWLRRVTLTTYTSRPLAQIVFGVIGLAPPSIGLIMTSIFRVIWTEKRPATAPVTNDFINNTYHTVTNLSAGQSWPIPAKTTCANPTSQFTLTG